MRYREWELKEDKSSGWTEVFRNNIFEVRVISIEEGRRYIWMRLKGTEEEIEYLSEDMMEK